jgi:hypothetical protein
MNKIEKVYYLLTNRLPNNYIIPIKIYKNSKTLLKNYCKKNEYNYTWVKSYYDNYFKQHQYIKTKYCNNHKKNKIKKISTAFDIAGLASYPISLAKNHLIKKSNKQIAFSILHEIGHFICGRNEIKVDKFAIRWVRKLIKEGLINEKE